MVMTFSDIPVRTPQSGTGFLELQHHDRSCIFADLTSEPFSGLGSAEPVAV